MLKHFTFLALLCAPLLGFSQLVPIHYWHFNDLPIDELEEVLADQSTTSDVGLILYSGESVGYMDRVNDGTTTNALQGVEPGFGLRVRNPSDNRELLLNVPTTGFTDIELSYAVKRTNNGSEGNSIEYSVANSIFQPIGNEYDITADYSTISIDFSGIAAANNNANFKIRILFTGDNAQLLDGNNRFDNITISGVPMSGVNVPPQLLQTIPFKQLVAGSSNLTIDLNTIFSDPDGDPLIFATSSSRSSVATASISGSTLSISPLAAGDTYITVSANDNNHPSIETSFRLLVYPQAHTVSEGSYSFRQWNSLAPAHTYPANMLFLQSDTDDPELNTQLLYPYNIPNDDYHDDDAGSVGFPYSTTRRTRIEGMGNKGISFINTARGRDLGGALVAIDTRNVTSTYVSWQGGTVLRNVREYAIRLQYRTSIDQPFVDVLADGSPVEYKASIDGDVEIFPNIPLPQNAIGKEYVQLLWRYYFVDGESGARAQLGLNNISIQSTQGVFRNIFETICHGESYTLGSQTLSSTGTYTEVFETSSGADSTVILSLMVKRVDVTLSVEGGEISANAAGATYQWLDCNNDFAAIDGATNQSYTPSISGSYAVRVTDGGCSEISACVLISANSAFTQKESSLNIYPNPSYGYITIQGNKPGNYMLVNTLGQVVSRFQLSVSNNHTQDITALSSGVYFVISLDSKQPAGKVVVTR